MWGRWRRATACDGAVPGGGATMHRRRTVVALAAATLSLSTGVADAAVNLSFQPPPGVHLSTEDLPPHYFRTTSTQPTIGIQADGGAAIRCGLDVLPSEAGPCGPPLPGCTAALCASYRPSSPLAGRPASAHDLAVTVVDSSNQIVAESDQGFTVDGTPPAVRFDNVDRDNPLRPVFGFRVLDDQPSAGFITVTDSFTCALVPVHANPAFGRCPAPPSDNEVSARYRVPRRHRDYRFWVKAVDDFGRTTTAHRDYDPVPCALKVSLPHRLRSVAAGILVRVDCSYVGTVDLGLWPMAVNGRTFARSPAQTVSGRPLLGAVRLRGKSTHWTARRRLMMTRSFASQTLGFHSVRFLLTACPASQLNPCSDRHLDASWSYLSFTARR
jgi:hypothetical protein